MDTRPGLTAVRPLLRWLVPFLLALTASEMVVARLLTPWPRDTRIRFAIGQAMDDLGAFTFVFSLLMAVFLLGLLGVITRWLDLWPSRIVGVGLVVFAFWSLMALWDLRAPGLRMLGGGGIAYSLASLSLSIIMLAVWFGDVGRGGPRAFAVLFAASLVCMFAASVPRLAVGWATAARGAGELLAIFCGVVAPALLPPGPGPAEEQARRAFAPAMLAAVLPGLFLLGLAHPRVEAPMRWSLGWGGHLPLPDRLGDLVYAGALFLFLFALFRALAEPWSRLQGYGLGFLFLAGIDYTHPYQHVLALVGLVLLTQGAMPDEPVEAPAG